MLTLTPDERAGTLAVFEECAFWQRVEERNKRPTLKQIMREVAIEHGVTPAQIVGKSHRAPIVAARHKVMYRARHETTLPLTEIGRRMGGRHYTSVMHGVSKHQERMACLGAAT